jgi:Family of unknown function (DUF5318)
VTRADRSVATLLRVPFHPGTPTTGAGVARPAGVVDHRMARHALVEEFRRGRLAQHEVCDAHPELRRAAEHISRRTTEICPICADRFLVLVTYAFGPHLPKSGYAVEDRADMDKVRRTTTECTCYVIEVCTGCGWNHLLQTFPVEGFRGT